MTDIEVMRSLANDYDSGQNGACLARLADRLEELEAIVAKLPKTKDGVPVVRDVDTLWCVYKGKVVELSYWDDSGNPAMDIDGAGEGMMYAGGVYEYGSPQVEDCYSSAREAMLSELT